VSTTSQLFSVSLFEEVFSSVLKICVDKGVVSGFTQVVVSAPVKTNACMDSLELNKYTGISKKVHKVNYAVLNKQLYTESTKI
jgi:hypothetical protein